MDTTLQLFQAITLLGVFKVLMVVLLGVYGVFAFLMMRQVAAMTRAISMKDDYLIRALATLHFGFAVVVLTTALVIL